MTEKLDNEERVLGRQLHLYANFCFIPNNSTYMSLKYCGTDVWAKYYAVYRQSLVCVWIPRPKGSIAQRLGTFEVTLSLLQMTRTRENGPRRVPVTQVTLSARRHCLPGDPIRLT